MNSACTNKLEHTTRVSTSLRPISTSFPVVHAESSSFHEKVISELHKRLTFPWIAVPDEDGVHILLLSRDFEKSVQRNVYVSFAGVVHVSVHRKPITGSLLQSILQQKDLVKTGDARKPHWQIFVENVIQVVNQLKSYEVCVGVDEQTFKALWDIDKLGEIDRNPYGELRYETTFRPFACHLLVPTSNFLKRRCSVCIETKIRFRVKMQRHISCEAPRSTPNIHLDRNQLLNKVKMQKRSLKGSRDQLAKLKSKLKHALSLNSVEVDQSVSDSVMKILMAYMTVEPFFDSAQDMQVKSQSLQN